MRRIARGDAPRRRRTDRCTIVVTGADGFIGRNLRVRLRERGHADVPRSYAATRPTASCAQALAGADFVFHLAGVNRPQDPAEFAAGNADFTRALCDALAAAAGAVPIVYASSTQAELDNPYGRSKRAAEDALRRATPRAPARRCHVYRLTERLRQVVPAELQLGGRDVLPQHRARPADHDQRSRRARCELVYIDDVVAAFLALLRRAGRRDGFVRGWRRSTRPPSGELADRSCRLSRTAAQTLRHRRASAPA